jgi:hypothetical protein
MSKKVAVYFDYESIWGMPWHDAEAYDLAKTTDRILAVLAKHDVKATFFVVGRLVETHPKIIQKIAKAGHTIGIHGYEHEPLNKISSSQLAEFDIRLSDVEKKIARLTGTKPTTFRSPFLMGPDFYTQELYNILFEHGYRYVSNREIRYQQELFSPSRLRISHWLNKDNLFTKTLTTLLNLRLIFTENISSKKGLAKVFANQHWLLNGCLPFMRGELLEVPVYSPLDCDLLGLPKPSEQSSDKVIAYATNAYVGGLNKKGEIYSLNFHDWIIGSQNRIAVLDDTLARLSIMPEVSFASNTDLFEQYVLEANQGSKLAGVLA